MKNHLIPKTLVLSLSMLGLPLAAQASEAALLKRIEKLAAELEQVKAELQATKQKTDVVEQKQEVLIARPVPVAPAPIIVQTAPAPVVTATAPVSSTPQTVITGYGEINYNRPKDASQAQADVRRAVIGLQHRFDDKTKLVTEFEWEHAIVSADDSGESEVEQIYIEREFDNGLRAKGGLFLIPLGLLNTNHEPTAYYGVERNFIETAIIPSTWREAGASVSSTMDNGLTWDAGLTTGFNLTKWDAAGTDGLESPLGSIHQEGQLAKSRDLSVFGALNWRGVPGLLLGGGIFTGKAGHKTAGFAANDARVTLWDLHARYNLGAWDLSALYARGTISNTDAINLTLVGNPTLIPASFQGWYAQAAYALWQSGNYKLSPFIRYEQYNTAKSYASLPAGLGNSSGPDEKVTTLGANLWLSEGVVLKADYQKFRQDKTRDRLDLGIAYSF